MFINEGSMKTLEYNVNEKNNYDCANNIYF